MPLIGVLTGMSRYLRCFLFLFLHYLIWLSSASVCYNESYCSTFLYYILVCLLFFITCLWLRLVGVPILCVNHYKCCLNNNTNKLFHLTDRNKHLEQNYNSLFAMSLKIKLELRSLLVHLMLINVSVVSRPACCWFIIQRVKQFSTYVKVVMKYTDFQFKQTDADMSPSECLVTKLILKSLGLLFNIALHIFKSVPLESDLMTY